MSKRTTATWYKRGRVWVVRPPGWPKNAELSFTGQKAMIQWAHDNGIVLKDVGRSGAA